MDFKSSPFYSVVKSKCPVCHQGDVFISKKVYNLKQFDKMHERCSVCNHKYEIETGFFYGAMYTSYGLTVLIGAIIFILIYLINPDTNYYLYLVYIGVVILFLFPITFRISRLMWMIICSSYNPNVKKNN